MTGPVDQTPATTKARHRRGAPQVTWLYPADTPTETADRTKKDEKVLEMPRVTAASFLGLYPIRTVDDFYANATRILELTFWSAKATLVVVVALAYLVWAIAR